MPRRPAALPPDIPVEFQSQAAEPGGGDDLGQDRALNPTRLDLRGAFIDGHPVKDLRRTVDPQVGLLAVGDLITKAGDYIFRLAVPLLLLELTGSALWAGLAFAVQTSATVVSGMLTGPIIDRGNPKTILQMSALAMAALAATVPVVGNVAPAAVIAVALVVSFALEVLNFAYRSCVNSIVPVLVTPTEIPNATAALSVSKFASKMIGAAIAGVLIATLGAANSILVDAASFVALAGVTVLIRVPVQFTKNDEKRSTKGDFFADLAEGIRYVWNDRPVLTLNAINFLANLGYVPVLAMFVIHLKQTVHLSPEAIGLIYAVDGVAALLAGIAIPTLMRRVATGPLVVGAVVALGAAVVGLSHLRAPIPIGALFFVVLGAAQVVNRVIFTHWQMTIPRTILGRVFGLSSAFENLASPIAAVAAGLVVQVTGSGTMLLVSGAVLILTGIGGAMSSVVRSIDSRSRGKVGAEVATAL